MGIKFERYSNEIANFIKINFNIPYATERDKLGNFAYYRIVINDVKIIVNGSGYVGIFDIDGMYHELMMYLPSRDREMIELCRYKVIIKHFIKSLLERSKNDSDNVSKFC